MKAKLALVLASVSMLGAVSASAETPTVQQISGDCYKTAVEAASKEAGFKKIYWSWWSDDAEATDPTHSPNEILVGYSPEGGDMDCEMTFDVTIEPLTIEQKPSQDTTVQGDASTATSCRIKSVRKDPGSGQC